MNSWVNHLAFKNIKRHRKRNIFSILSLIVGLVASFLIVGFSNNAVNSVKEECYRQFDYGTLTISKENRTESKSGGLSIVRNVRPTFLEMADLKDKLIDYEIELNFSSLIPTFPLIKRDKDELKDFSFEPIYSFSSPYIDTDLIIGGKKAKDDLSGVMINYKAYEKYYDQFHHSPIGQSINIYQESTFFYYTGDTSIPAIKDTFIFEKTLKIVGICDDLSFLSTPKIYYSYLGMKDYLSSILLNNLSSYFKRDISWLERIDEANGNEDITSFSYLLFLKDYRNREIVNEFISSVIEPYVISSSAETRSSALVDLIKAATTGMEVFLFISLLGTALIMGIVSFSFYSEERKNIAILSCLGAKIDDINDIYCVENLSIGIISFVLSLIISPLLELLINFLIKRFAGFSNLIKIPFSRFLGIPFGFPLIIFIGTIVISIFSTMLPIAFSKKISLKEELKDE